MRNASRWKISLLALAAALVLAYQAALVARWVQVDAHPPSWDPSVHLSTALDYREAWEGRRWLDMLLTKPKPGHPPYPPLYHYTLIPLLGLPHPHIAVAWLNLVYWAILVLAAAWIAWQLARPPASPFWASLMTLVFLGLSPGLIYKYREAFVDLALAAWVTLAYALLVHSRGYERRLSSLGIGICAGLALNSKWSALLYLWPCLLPGLAAQARARRNLALALGAAALLCLPWYLVNGVQMLPRIWVSLTLGHQQGDPLTWTWENWKFYVSFLALCFSWPLVWALLAGSARALFRFGSWKTLEGRNFVLIALWLFGSYLLSTLTPSKNWRYFLPAAGALPALGAAGLPAPALAGALYLARHHGRELRRPEPGDWYNADILRAVEKRRDPARALSSLCLLANHRFLNSTSLGWQARNMALPHISLGCQQNEIPEWADFVLVKSIEPGAFLADNTLRILSEALSGKGLFSQVFREAQRWPLPDGSEAILFEQKPGLRLIGSARHFKELRVKNARLDSVDIRPLGRGRYELKIGALTLANLSAPVRGIAATLEGARLLEREGKVHVLGLDRLTLASAEISWEELSRALSARARLPISVSGKDSRIRIEAHLGPLPLGMGLSLSQTEHDLKIEAQDIHLAGLPLWGVRLSGRQNLEAKAPYQPYSLALSPLRILGQGLKIGHGSLSH
ncbi:MAG: hypothetical protein HY921_12860 [Elusimicrobia bacterium]|nr:hypothetical protein [Elusimicrobiota bacterium]